jgi:hypothetical protein
MAVRDEHRRMPAEPLRALAGTSGPGLLTGSCDVGRALPGVTSGRALGEVAPRGGSCIGHPAVLPITVYGVEVAFSVLVLGGRAFLGAFT